MPFPTPTNGSAVAANVSLAGTGLVLLASQLVPSASSQNTAPSGVQFKGWFGGSFPGGADFAAIPGVGVGAAGATSGADQYGLTLSISAAGGFASTCQLTTTIYDTVGAIVSQGSVSPVYVSYADPVFSGFNPKTASTGFPVPTNSNGQVASVSGSGLITALHVGQAIIEVQYPFASNTLSNMSGDSQDPVARQMVYAQIVVEVIP